MTISNFNQIISDLRLELQDQKPESSEDLKLAISLLENYAKIQASENPRTSEDARSDASAAFQNKNYSKASAYFSEAIKLNPSDARNYTNRAACYLHLADSDCTKATELDPNFTRAFTRKAHISIAQGKWDSAEEALVKSLNLSKDSETVKLHDFVQGYRNPRIRNETSATDSLDYDVVGNSLISLITHPKVSAALSKFTEAYQKCGNTAETVSSLTKEYPRMARIDIKDPKYDDILNKLKYANIEFSDTLEVINYFKFEHKHIQDYISICKELADAMNIENSSKSSSMFM